MGVAALMRQHDCCCASTASGLARPRREFIALWDSAPGAMEDTVTFLLRQT
jgi:hypothetical protein